MITVGIDCGSQNTKGVALKAGKLVAKTKVLTEFDANKATQKVYETLLIESGIKNDAVVSVAITGSGRSIVELTEVKLNELNAAALGARFVKPDTYLVIDIGAESCRVIRLTEEGMVKKYEVNDKCASGAGTFIETMARALQISVEEMGPYSLRHTKELTTNSQCVVFAESEVVSLIHRQETKEDIAYGIHMGISNRVAALIRRVGIADNPTLIGGPGHNKGLIQCLGKQFGKEIFVSENTDFVSAIGAAVYAAQTA